MGSPTRTRFWSPLLAIALFPALLQQDCATPPAYHLTTLEVEAGGLDRIVGFTPTLSKYDMWTTAGVDTIVIRAVALISEAELDYELAFAGPPVTGVLGVGGGEATLSIPPDTPGELKIGVKFGGVRRAYTVNINPPCDTAPCDDANACTSDVCNVATCEFTTLANGTSCPIALATCDAGSGPGAGACQSGLCTASLEVCPCDAETAYQAVPKECASGAVFDPGTGACTCDVLGAVEPQGGTCAQFGTPVVAGCELPHPLLGSQVAFNVTIVYGVTSPGAGGPGTVDHRARIRLESNAIIPWGGVEIVQRAEVVIGSQPGGTPATLVNSLDPALSGQPLGAFKDSDTVVDLDTEILDATTPFEPASGESVDFQLVDFIFEFEIATNGDRLVLDRSMCTFDNPGTVLEPGAPPADGTPIACPVRVAP